MRNGGSKSGGEWRRLAGRTGEEKSGHDGLSFDPSLSDAPFNVLTETTWGTLREVVCLFIRARGRGITRL